MKPGQLYITAVFLLIISGCDKEEQETDKNIKVSSASFTGCKTETKSTVPDIPSIKLTGQTGDMLQVDWSNTEFCCGTDSISISSNISGNDIKVEIIDLGPFTWCYCPHDLSFSIGPLKKEDYNLTLIESEHSYVRDTFLLSFDYSQQLDTTITGEDQVNTISNNPVNYAKTIKGGCNNFSLKSATFDDLPENDTVIIYELTDTIRIFVGLHLTCCMEFEPESYVSGDTLFMKIVTVNDEFCNCICYYTFDYYFADYTGQGFYYQFLSDDYKWFEGSHNLP